MKCLIKRSILVISLFCNIVIAQEGAAEIDINRFANDLCKDEQTQQHTLKALTNYYQSPNCRTQTEATLTKCYAAVKSRVFDLEKERNLSSSDVGNIITENLIYCTKAITELAISLREDLFDSNQKYNIHDLSDQLCNAKMGEEFNQCKNGLKHKAFVCFDSYQLDGSGTIDIEETYTAQVRACLKQLVTKFVDSSEKFTKLTLKRSLLTLPAYQTYCSKILSRANLDLTLDKCMANMDKYAAQCFEQASYGLPDIIEGEMRSIFSKRFLRCNIENMK